MKRVDFLNELYAYLSPLPKKERMEILDDFREHFREGGLAGKTEEQICFELGSPIECARQYVGDAAENGIKPNSHKTFWTLALVVNAIEVVVSVPLTAGLFAAGAIMCVLFAFTVPPVGSVAFTVFAVSSTAAVFLLAILTLLLAIDGIRTCIKKINR